MIMIIIYNCIHKFKVNAKNINHEKLLSRFKL